MTRPKWHEAWLDAFDGEEATPVQHPLEKKAIAVRRKEDGSTEILKTATGAEALQMIAQAEAQGISVEKDSDRVESLMAEQNGATDVPPEIYQIMSVVIDFAQELCQEWKSSKTESLLEPGPKLVTEVEYTMDDGGS